MTDVKKQDGFAKSLALLQGATGILNTALTSGRGTDVSRYRSGLEYNSRPIGSNYYDYSTVLQDSLSIPTGLSVGADDINPTLGQSIGNGLTGAINGGITGFQVAGIPGAIIGGVLGGGAVAIGDLYGRNTNKFNASILNNESGNMRSLRSLQVNTGAEQVHDNMFGDAYASRKAMGGKIQKKEQSIEDFSKMVLGRQKSNDTTHSAGIVRTHCNGGTMVRIKMK